MDQILKTLQNLLTEHLAYTQPLAQPLVAGNTVITVPNTSRFRPKDDAFVMRPSMNIMEQISIARIIDWQRLLLATPIRNAWPTSGVNVTKAPGGLFLKRVYAADLQVIPDFPAIAIEPSGESNEWMTLRSTTHEYRFSITSYVLADDMEKTNPISIKYGQQIREILLDHIHLLVLPVSYPLTKDVLKGDSVISVASTAKFYPGHVIILRDAQVYPGNDEYRIKEILSPTQIQVQSAIDRDFLVVRQGELLWSPRYLYDTRPSDIEYGFMGKGGSLLKGARVSWFAKEQIFRQGDLET